MSATLESKLNKLTEKMEGGREDHLKEVVAMQKTLKDAMLKKNLKQHPALQKLLSLLRKREEGYTILLGNKEDLTEVKRAEYFARRAETRFIISFFDSADRTIANIEKSVDYQLSEDINSGPDEDA